MTDRPTPTPPMPQPVAKLRTRALAFATFAALRDNYRPMAGALVAPWLVSVLLARLLVAAVEPAADGMPVVSQNWVEWPLYLVQGYFMLAYAVTCHRITLLGPAYRPSVFGVGFSGREWRYLLYSATIVVLSALPVAFVTTAAPGLFNIATEAGSFALLILLTPALLFALVFSLRMSLSLPLIALDGPPGLRKNFGIAWKLMGGSTWKFLLAAVFVNVPFLIVFSILIAMSAQLSVATGTVFPFIAVSYLGNFISAALTATLLSVAFRTLTGFDGTTTRNRGSDDD